MLMCAAQNDSDAQWPWEKKGRALVGKRDEAVEFAFDSLSKQRGGEDSSLQT